MQKRITPARSVRCNKMQRRCDVHPDGCLFMPISTHTRYAVNSLLTQHCHACTKPTSGSLTLKVSQAPISLCLRRQCRSTMIRSARQPIDGGLCIGLPRLETAWHNIPILRRTTLPELSGQMQSFHPWRLRALGARSTLCVMNRVVHLGHSPP